MKKLPSVLIIDDNEGDRFIAEKMFQRAKACDHVFHMRDGQEGIEFLQHYEDNKLKYGDEFPPVLILLDINMPRMNGFEFLEKFQKLPSNDGYGSVVIVMFTSSENADDQRRVMQFDAVKGFIVKPLSVAKLNQCIEAYF